MNRETMVTKTIKILAFILIQIFLIPKKPKFGKCLQHFYPYFTIETVAVIIMKLQKVEIIVSYFRYMYNIGISVRSTNNKSTK